jgi:hypothetical protein
MRRLAVTVTVLALAGCSSPSTPSDGVPLGQPFTLQPGQAATVADTTLSLVFQQVTDDSRCPADATCVWAGEAVVELEADEGPGGPRALQLSTTAAEKAVGDYTVRLTEVQPYPFASKPPIQAKDYRVTLVVQRRK